MTLPNRITKLAIGVGAIGLMAGTATAGDYGKAIIDDKMPIEAWEFCDIFDIPTLYESETGLIREVKLLGRYQGQWISQNEDINDVNNNGYHEFEHRRFRQGIEIGFANDITFEAVMNITDGSGGGRPPLTRGRFFDDFDTISVTWAPAKDTYVSVGKQKQKITLENETSSSKIITIERSAITNEVISDKPWGITYGFKALDIKHEIGAFIAGADLDSSGEGYLFPDFDSRGGLAYRASKKVTDATEVHFDYQFWNNSSGAVSTLTTNRVGGADVSIGSAYEHVITLGTKSTMGDFGLITDLIYGANRNRQGGGTNSGAIPAGDDTWGLVIMPYYNITDKLQGVFRYSYMDSGREQRTQRFDVRDNVEDYHTFYAGLNYYICGDNLKIQGGYEYATGETFGNGNDIDTGSWQLGLRVNY